MLRSKSLEIHVADHCNLDCRGCAHASPMLPRRYEDIDQLTTALEVLWTFYRADRIRLVGGEPLLHPRLGDLVSTVKAVTSAPVQLVTNAVLLERRLGQLACVDEIEVSVYPGVRQPDTDRLRAIGEHLALPIVVKEYEHFRWHRRPPDGDRDTTERIFKTCQMFHHCDCHTVRAGHFYPCPPAATWAEHNGDGVDLSIEACEAGAAARRLLVRSEAFASCAECLGSTGTLIPHAQGWRSTPDWAPVRLLDERHLALLEHRPDAHNACHGDERVLMHGLDQP